MARGADVDKARAWRQRLGRFARHGHSVATFCAAERVSVATFYYWKRKLSGTALPARQHTPHSRTRQVSFVPVRLTEAGMPGPRDKAATVVEVALPNGSRVLVPVNELRAIRVVVKSAGQLRAPSAREER